ncbi:MAG: AAA family ATPase [Bacteroidetes bacterium]|nr:AAA family ATPase [Bacteroidota bacterium]
MSAGSEILKKLESTVEVMEGFKLLAIRPLKGCNKRLLKILEENRLYKFYQDYEFVFDSKKQTKVKKVVPPKSGIEDLYNIEWLDDRGYQLKELLISVSAIVGKNGAGKSSLLDLIYAANYQLALYAGILTYNNDIEINWVSASVFKKLPAQKKRLKSIENLKLELFYEKDGQIIELTINSNRSVDNAQLNTSPFKFRILSSPDPNSKRNFNLSSLLKDTKNFIREYFFYTVAVNYSAYSLNSLQMGKWLDYVVHKNDGYQTPLVINPKRTKGDIDINVENDLVVQRLMSNILEPLGNNKSDDSLRNIAPGKTVSYLELSINWGKIDGLPEGKKAKNFDRLLAALYKRYVREDYDARKVSNKMLTIEFYLLNKIIKICTIYDPYKKYYDGVSFKITGLVKKICNDESHITFKIRQALNWLKYNHVPRVFSNLERSFKFPIDELVSNIQKIKENNPDRNLKTIELIPPSFFETRLKFSDKGYFDEMSSGEKQKIFSTSTIVYHLININSVFNRKLERLEQGVDNKYNYVNILFDEVELYFHPEYQRTYISDFISYLNKINPTNIFHISGLNVCFSTHSPFILSDLPSSNILRLIDGKPTYVNEQTFGANIHQLLHNDFFLENGFTGEFARRKINNVVDSLRSVKLSLDEKSLETKKLRSSKEELKNIETRLEIIRLEKSLIPIHQKKLSQNACKKIIELIGEPLLFATISSLYEEVFREPISQLDDSH